MTLQHVKRYSLVLVNIFCLSDWHISKKFAIALYWQKGSGRGIAICVLLVECKLE